MTDKLAAELVTRLFHARTNSHLQHLMTRSYATHKALNDFYDGVVPLADIFAEAYQGVYGLLPSYPAEYKQELDPLPMLVGLRKWIDENRGKITERRELQNVIDEILNLVDGTVYKLRFLS
jgi:hypothetical protein